MTGPYLIRFTRLSNDAPIATFAADVVVRDESVYKIADRYRALALVSSPITNAERASIVVAAALIEAGDEWLAEIVGRVDGRDGIVCRSNRVRRESDGRLVSSIGSRFGEREIRGL